MPEFYRFCIKPNTIVSNFKKTFRKKLGCTIRVYEGNKEANPNATLESLGASEVILSFPIRYTIADIIRIFQKRNLKIRFFTLDNKTALFDNIPICAIRYIPKSANRKEVESFCAYHTAVYNDDVNSIKSGVNIKLHECSLEELIAKVESRPYHYHVIASSIIPYGRRVAFIYGSKLLNINKLLNSFKDSEVFTCGNNIRLYYFEENDSDIMYTHIGIKYLLDEVQNRLGLTYELDDCINRKMKKNRGWLYNLIVGDEVIASFEG